MDECLRCMARRLNGETMTGRTRPRLGPGRPAGDHAAGNAQLPQCRGHRPGRVFDQPGRLQCLSRRVPHRSLRSAPTTVTGVVSTRCVSSLSATACVSGSCSWHRSVTSLDGLPPSCPRPIMADQPRHTPCSSGHRQGDGSLLGDHASRGPRSRLGTGRRFHRGGDAPGRWCADAGRPTRFKPSSPSPTDAVRDGSAKLGHPVQNVTREHGLTPLPR